MHENDWVDSRYPLVIPQFVVQDIPSGPTCTDSAGDLSFVKLKAPQRNTRSRLPRHSPPPPLSGMSAPKFTSHLKSQTSPSYLVSGKKSLHNNFLAGCYHM